MYLTVPVSNPHVRLSDSSAVEGSSFWMRCDLENGTEPIHYMWEQENRSGQVSLLAESNNSLFIITAVNRNHTGWFSCLARNEVNQEHSAKIWLDVLCKCGLFHICNNIAFYINFREGFDQFYSICSSGRMYLGTPVHVLMYAAM